MGWGSEHSAVAAFARELGCYRGEHGTPTGEAMDTASLALAGQDAAATPSARGVGEHLSAARISGLLAGNSVKPPTQAAVFSFVRVVLHLEDPTADPITPEHPDVKELLVLRSRAIARQSLGTFRERHLTTALKGAQAANVRHGCFAFHALNGATLYVGSTTSEPIVTRIKALLEPDGHDVDREHVAELELWPMPELATAPDAEAVIARIEDALILRALYASAPKALRLPHRDIVKEPAIPASRRFPLVDPGTLLAVREALRDQASELASIAEDSYARTEAFFQRRFQETN